MCSHTESSLEVHRLQQACLLHHKHICQNNILRVELEVQRSSLLERLQPTGPRCIRCCLAARWFAWRTCLLLKGWRHILYNTVRLKRDLSSQCEIVWLKMLLALMLLTVGASLSGWPDMWGNVGDIPRGRELGGGCKLNAWAFDNNGGAQRGCLRRERGARPWSVGLSLWLTDCVLRLCSRAAHSNR